MATKTLGSFDFARLQQTLTEQFSGLDPKDPSSWPSIPRIALFTVTAVAIVVILWFVWLDGENEILLQAQAKEVTLRVDYKAKLAKADRKSVV